MSARETFQDLCTEKEFQATVVQYAELCGWRTYHTHDSRRSAPGFPDLTLVRDGQLVFAELKSKAGRVSHEQQEWLTDLLAVAYRTSAISVFVWYPSDWELIEAALA